MLRSAAAIVLIAVFLQGCGTRGALYLPEPAQKAKQEEPPRK